MDHQIKLLLDAIDSYIEAKLERDNAFASCDSSWGYFGYDCEQKLKLKRAEIKAHFCEAVKLAVKEVGQ